MLEELRQVVPLLTPNAPRSDLCRLVVDENLLRRDSLASRKKLSTKLATRYFRRETPAATAHFVTAARDVQDPAQFALLAYTLFVWNDALAFTLGLDWLAPKLRGETFVAETSDIDRELRIIAQEFPAISNWRNPTLRRVAQHYLGLLRDCGFATGAKHKTLRRPYVGPGVVLYGVRLVLGSGVAPDRVPGHSLFSTLGLSLEDVLDSLTELQATGMARFASQGGVVHLEILEGDEIA